MPKISVLMSVYNEPVDWMRQAIESILNQTYKDFEFIIVNDNPEREENQFVLNEYRNKDSRIIILCNEHNIGLTKSLNKGLAVASGEYIARMDADDIALPKRFEKQALFLAKNINVFLCHTNFNIIDINGNVKNKAYKFPGYSYLFIQNTIAHPTVMFRKSFINLRFPLYDENCKRAQDYELWTYLYLEGKKFAYIPDKLLNYRISQNQITSIHSCSQKSTFKLMRTNFILSYFRNKGYKLDLSNPSDSIEKIRSIYNSSDEINKQILGLILFLCYFNLPHADVLNFLKYLLHNAFWKLKFRLKMQLISRFVLHKNYPSYEF